MQNLMRCVAVASSLAALALSTASAQAFVVQDLGINPGETVNISVQNFYTGDAAAGINKLAFGKVSADGFCIDPFHFSVSSSPGYQFRSLAEAPKLPGTMGAEKAEQISRLWSMVYSPFMTPQNAAGMQVAIWEIVGGDRFSVSGNDYGAGVMLHNLENYSGAGARLIALSGPGQDYVTPTPAPDTGSTLSLFLLAAVGLASMRRIRPMARQAVRR